MYRHIEDTVFSTTLPCNTLPVLDRLRALLGENNTNSLMSLSHLQDDRVTRLIWLLIAQYYGEAAIVDLMEEYTRFYKIEQAREENRRQALKEHTIVGG